VSDLETSRIGAPYIYDISSLRDKPQGIKLRDLCIWLVDLFEYMRRFKSPETLYFVD